MKSQQILNIEGNTIFNLNESWWLEAEFIYKW